MALAISVSTSGLNKLTDVIRKHRVSLLDAVGVKALELARRNYETKSLGRAGVDGDWEPLGETAVAARVQRMPEYSIYRAQKKALSREAAAAKASLKGSERKAAEANLKAAREQLKGQYSRMYAKKDNGKIGKDQGNLHASLLRGAEGNRFTVEDMAVEIATEVAHAEYFDALRPVLPESLPDEWVGELERELSETLQTLAPEVL